MAIPPPPTDIPPNLSAPASSRKAAARDQGLLDAALAATSQLAVLWAFGLALLLILAHRA